jgi:hypothetical protein
MWRTRLAAHTVLYLLDVLASRRYIGVALRATIAGTWMQRGGLLHTTVHLSVEVLASRSGFGASVLQAGAAVRMPRVTKWLPLPQHCLYCVDGIEWKHALQELCMSHNVKVALRKGHHVGLLELRAEDLV